VESPIRILAVVPEPIDAPWSSAAAAAWTSIESALRAATRGAGVEIVRLKPATATALEELIERDSFNIVHVVSRGTSRPAARYGTLTLEGSDARARDLNAQNFAKLCARMPHLELVVLQHVAGTPADLDVLRDALLLQAASVVSAPAAGPDSRESTEFARLLYTALASGQSIADAFAIATRNPSVLPASTSGSGPGIATLRLRDRPATQRPAATRRDTSEREAAPAAASPPRPTRVEPPAPAGVPADEDAREAQRQVDRKRTAGAFDVFLCHNVGDKPAVMEIGRRLMARGLLPWLDQWELRPGTPWQRVLEEQIANIHAAAVFVGREGIGPWQRQELDGFLREFNKRGCPVIPVLLPGAGGEPELPLFLRGMTWVDFRETAPDPLAQLMWGITGQRPSQF
jgi:hypothetical protein